jgi:hypothetical protein
MIRFIDGPAAGVKLTLRRTPILLRVVFNGSTWDALDQLDDTPAADETVHVYRVASVPSTYHIDYTDRATGRRRGEWRTTADYAFYATPPDDAVRATEAWRAWTMAREAAVRLAVGEEILSRILRQ